MRIDPISALLGLGTIGVLGYAGFLMLFARPRKSSSTAPRDIRVPTMTDTDIAALEAHYGTPVPDDLVWLYRESGLASKRVIERYSTIEPYLPYRIENFLPGDLSELQTPWLETIGSGKFPFAEDGSGNYYLVRLERGGSPQVTFLDHDGMAEWPVADNIREFLVGKPVAST